MKKEQGSDADSTPDSSPARKAHRRLTREEALEQARRSGAEIRPPRCLVEALKQAGLYKPKGS